MTIKNVVVNEQCKEATKTLDEGVAIVLKMPLLKREPYNKKLGAISDRLKSLTSQYETVEQYADSNLSPRLIESLKEERKDLETSIAALLSEVKSLVKEMSEIVKLSYKKAHDDYTIDKPFPWWIVAVILGLLTWITWRNHDFNSAAFYKNETILIKNDALNSELAAMLAGCVIAAFVMVIGEVSIMLKRSTKSSKTNNETKDESIDGKVVGNEPETNSTKDTTSTESKVAEEESESRA